MFPEKQERKKGGSPERCGGGCDEKSDDMI